MDQSSQKIPEEPTSESRTFSANSINMTTETNYLADITDDGI